MTINEMREQKARRRYTYQMLSERSGIPVPTLQKIFSGETQFPRRQTLLALERAFAELEKETARSLYGGNTEQKELLRDGGQAYKTPQEQHGGGDGSSAASRAEGERIWPRQGTYTAEDYLALPDEQRVELIDGVFWNMSSPGVIHQWIVGEVYRQISNYIHAHGGACRPFIAPVDVRLDNDDRTMVQPDVMILCDPGKLSPERVNGAPDYVLEVISPSTKRKDYTLKLHKYQTAGVREYWILDPRQEVVLIYYFESDDIPVIRGLGEPVPVGIYGGDLQIDLRGVQEWIRQSKGGRDQEP